MIPAQIAALLIPLLPASPPLDDPELSLGYHAGVLEFRVDGPTTFLGGVILSLDPSLCHYFKGLPPLLCNYTILGVGVAQKGTFVASVHESQLPAGFFIHAQGVLAAEGGIQSTKVIDFVLDASKPPAEADRAR